MTLSAVLLAAPAAAQAANSYVDQEAGDDFNSCLAPGAPCEHVAAGISKAGPGNTVFVDGDEYFENVTLDNGKSLVAQEFVGHPDGAAIIDGGLGVPAITINDAATAGTIQGLTLRGAFTAVDAYGSATFIGNNFDDDVDPGGFPNLRLVAGSGENIVVQNNTFSDPTPADDQLGIQLAMTGTGTSTISGNTINNFWKGILVTGGSGTQQISDNMITGTHEHGASMLPGAGIWLEGASTVSLTHNLIQQPGVGGTLGITSNPTGGVLNVEMKRNRVFDHTYGVDLHCTSVATLNGDVIANNTSVGLNNSDCAPGAGLGNTNARNVTIWDNGCEICIDEANLTLNSSIVEGGVSPFNSNMDPGEDPVCTITFSRGNTIDPGQLDGCANFQTTAAPGFVDPTQGINNFHLTLGSPMIDMGSTIAPPPGTLDVDGDPRVVAGQCGGTARADIGADEFVPNCTPPAGPTTPTVNPPAAGPQGGASLKKKKKCKKKKGAAAAKKCKRK